MVGCLVAKKKFNFTGRRKKREKWKGKGCERVSLVWRPFDLTSEQSTPGSWWLPLQRLRTSRKPPGVNTGMSDRLSETLAPGWPPSPAWYTCLSSQFTFATSAGLVGSEDASTVATCAAICLCAATNEASPVALCGLWTHQSSTPRLRKYQQ